MWFQDARTVASDCLKAIIISVDFNLVKRLDIGTFPMVLVKWGETKRDSGGVPDLKCILPVFGANWGC